MNAKHRRIPISIATIMCLVLLPACSGKTATTNTDPNALPGVHVNDVGTPISGGIYRVAAVADAPSLDPLKESSVATHAAIGIVYSKLIDYKIGPDEPFGTSDLEGDLATSWGPSADGLTWTFHLRQGVKFQNIDPVNGREFTSADVLCTLDGIRQRGQQRGDISMIKSWSAPDKYTVVMNLDAPYPDLAYKFAGNFLWMLPCEGVQEKFDMLTKAIGTGPFQITSWVQGRERKYAKNPTYYVPGKPYLDGVDTIIIPDSSAQAAALRTKKVDVIATLQDLASVQALAKSDPNIFVTKEMQYAPFIVYMNQAVKPFDDLRVRQAVSLAIDRQGMIKALRPGGLVSGPVTPLVSGALTPDEVKTLQPYDPNKAKDLLAQAGLSGGFEAKMLITNGYGDTVIREAQWVQEDLAKVGIKLTIDQQDYATYFTKSFAGKQYAIGAGLQTPWLTADDMLISQWYSKGTRNWFNINDPQLDKMILDTRPLADPAKRADADKDVERYIIKNISNPLPLYIYEAFVVYGGYMHGIHPQPEYGGRHLINVWMDKDAPGRTT
jgi:peptide/nickel transport system substrate-binding protein